MVVETQRMEELRLETERIRKVNIHEEYLPEWLGQFEFNEPDKKKYFNKQKSELREYYLMYEYQCKQKGFVPKFTYQQFREYTTLLLSMVTTYICETGRWVKLPFGMGQIGISKYKPRYYKPLFIWGKKDADGKRLAPEIQLNPNNHTSGYVCKFSWIKDNVLLTNKVMWKHNASAFLKSTLYKSITQLNTIDLYEEISREAEGLTKEKGSRSAAKIKGEVMNREERAAAREQKRLDKEEEKRVKEEIKQKAKLAKDIEIKHKKVNSTKYI